MVGKYYFFQHNGTGDPRPPSLIVIGCLRHVTDRRDAAGLDRGFGEEI